MEKRKYYVVWVGYAPGIYESWEECKQQIENFSGARYKAFSSKESAIRAFRGDNNQESGMLGLVAKALVGHQSAATSPPAYIIDSIAVDAACSGNPGKMEYRGVYVKTGQELFHFGPEPDGTNNIGEFLALVHGLVFLKKNNSNLPLYSDSVNAISWVRQKKCKTKLERSLANDRIFRAIERAEEILRTTTFSTRILKWETKIWGEIPADFGRK